MSWLSGPSEYKIHLSINGIVVDKGSVVVNVYTTEANFLKKAFITQTLKTTNKLADTDFNLPAGTYAIAIYQDLNNNRKLDKGLLGIPNEPYGFSNSYRPSFGSPDFDACKLLIKNDESVNVLIK